MVRIEPPDGCTFTGGIGGVAVENADFADLGNGIVFFKGSEPLFPARATKAAKPNFSIRASRQKPGSPDRVLVVTLYAESAQPVSRTFTLRAT